MKRKRTWGSERAGRGQAQRLRRARTTASGPAKGRERSVGATPGRRPRGCREATTAMLDGANAISCESNGPAGAGPQDAARAGGRTRCGHGHGEAGPSRPLPPPPRHGAGLQVSSVPGCRGGLHAGRPRSTGDRDSSPAAHWAVGESPHRQHGVRGGKVGSLSPFPSTPAGRASFSKLRKLTSPSPHLSRRKPGSQGCWKDTHRGHEALAAQTLGPPHKGAIVTALPCPTEQRQALPGS